MNTSNEKNSLAGIQKFLDTTKQPSFDMESYLATAKSSRVDGEYASLIQAREGLLGWIKTIEG